jgi:hypothetical protein
MSDGLANSDLPRSGAYHAERETLPLHLRPVYDSLVESYRFHAVVHYRTPFVSYKVLADLVREGWRRQQLTDEEGRAEGAEGTARP